MNIPNSILTIVLFSLFGFSSNAQDKEDSYGIFENQQQYYEFMGNVKREGQDNPELMAMVPMINDIVLMQPFGSTSKRYGIADGTLGTLADESVRQDLEMIDSQFVELQKTNAEIQQRFAEQIRQLDMSDMQAAVRKILELRSLAERELQATLLPHQMQRLRELAARKQLRERSLVEVITSEPIKTKLKMSDEQAAELIAAERDIKDELKRQIAALRNQARKQLLAKLKSDQRQKVKEIFGSELTTFANKSSSKK